MSVCAPVTAVISSLSIILPFPKSTLIVLLTPLITNLCTLPNRSARSGLKYHLLSLLEVDYFIYFFLLRHPPALKVFFLHQ